MTTTNGRGDNGDGRGDKCDDRRRLDRATMERTGHDGGNNRVVRSGRRQYMS